MYVHCSGDSWDSYSLYQNELEHPFSFNFVITSERWKKVLFILSAFVEDIQVAIKAWKSDQFYEQLNGVCPKVINFMVEAVQGDAIIFLYLWW